MGTARPQLSRYFHIWFRSQPRLWRRPEKCIFRVVVIGVVVTWTRYENIWTVAVVQSPQVAVPGGSSCPHIFILSFSELLTTQGTAAYADVVVTTVIFHFSWRHLRGSVLWQWLASYHLSILVYYLFCAQSHQMLHSFEHSRDTWQLDTLWWRTSPKLTLLGTNLDAIMLAQIKLPHQRFSAFDSSPVIAETHRWLPVLAVLLHTWR